MAKKRAEHIVGKKYYYDEVIPERAKTRTRSKAKQTKYKKHFGSQETIFLNSTEILKSQKLGYLSLMVKLRKDKTAIVYLYDYSNKKTTYFTDFINSNNKLTLSKKLPAVLDFYVPKYTRYVSLAIPINEWNKTENKSEIILKYYPLKILSFLTNYRIY